MSASVVVALVVLFGAACGDKSADDDQGDEAAPSQADASVCRAMGSFLVTWAAGYADDAVTEQERTLMFDALDRLRDTADLADNPRMSASGASTADALQALVLTGKAPVGYEEGTVKTFETQCDALGVPWPKGSPAAP